MIRTTLSALLLCTACASLAEEPSKPSFKAPSLGEAAAIGTDLSKPIALELEIPLRGPVKDLAPLVAYLRSEGFDLVAEVNPPPGTPGDMQSLAFKARKHGVLAKDAIDRWAREVHPLVPEGLRENWNLRQAPAGS
ncbi:MAG: hypothetical protein K0M70_13635 [Arenimonas sp.]|uniref:hypothetical protein n=1 Tax=Arenimonas sp. TaxID=1872635 RepID=UPI0025BB4B80|nr:hypothetical protein [Arenimonas sp.]MBW8368887.1 hypothetical protein [Arenimonas sp.]